jgi:hypothetical protein
MQTSSSTDPPRPTPRTLAAWAALVLNLVIFVLCFFIVERYGHARMPPTKRTWYDFLIRAGMVALLVGAVLTLSFRIGPAGSGILAVFPVIYTSIMVILHCRVGGPATAAVLAHAIPGLAGFGMALLTLHLTQCRSVRSQPSLLLSACPLHGTSWCMCYSASKSILKFPECPLLAQRVNSRHRSNSVAFGVKRTFSEPLTEPN